MEIDGVPTMVATPSSLSVVGLLDTVWPVRTPGHESAGVRIAVVRIADPLCRSISLISSADPCHGSIRPIRTGDLPGKNYRLHGEFAAGAAAVRGKQNIQKIAARLVVSSVEQLCLRTLIATIFAQRLETIRMMRLRRRSE